MLDTMFFWLLIALFAPLVSAIFAGIFIKFRDKLFVGIICSCLIVLGTIASLWLVEFVLQNGGMDIALANFISAGELNIKYGVMIDALSTIMAITVGIVSSVVHIYSIYYMQKDPGFAKFFAYLGLFVFSMLVLVLSDNFIGLFIGWEGVGLCSWLLIGFWHDRDNNAWCANEAFIMNRVADLAMLLGIFAIYLNFGSFAYDDVLANASTADRGALALIAALLFIGAMGKSAQFPFHTWLADAMAGPTPVSALIHAATMVTAGVYLVIRANSIFALAPDVAQAITYLGAFVAIFAASMACVHNDLKKIIAYSTLSQLGYMFVAAGLGAYAIALFHLVTHAFFKSLLFLGAGNVMHAMNDKLNIQKMGALAKFMKPSLALMSIGSLALCGFYPFSGFFSKDKILETAFASGAHFIWAVLFFGAILTTFYSFRLLMLVFFGEKKYDHHPHEAKPYALLAMSVLAVLAMICGFFAPEFYGFVGYVLPSFHNEISHNTEILLIALTLGAISVVAIATIFAYKNAKFSPNLKNSKIYKILSVQYFIPQFYDIFIVGSYKIISQICAKIDSAIIDSIVDLIAKALLKMGFALQGANDGTNLGANLRLMIFGFFALLVLVFLI
ncbi:NADH-quinone oxidoreductase subunit L [Campylobacter sp. VBCF_06 NA8]|uniref:NADH-quinone oxidoreductase subunit L n=1 Tax=Campylobacter sp. VBCF_06 NA8 TaxID=2983822 RepID=UPI0022E9E4B4|nr:NADH-quinone oxidoreductase subunit L [Campylobacter sp. VBCF_06 NA8]MDA3045855.1 NADH-quinone oxidoreductase subunit L [Campylobacter sp. VBCF_06 NA8]